MLRSVVLEKAAIDRAAALGRNVASQLGVAFDEARYLGPPGLCPMCHLDVVVLRAANVECATCGARGLLAPDQRVTWTDLSASVISMDEKRAHAAEILHTAKLHAGSAPRSRSAPASSTPTTPSCGRGKPRPPTGYPEASLL